MSSMSPGYLQRFALPEKTGASAQCHLLLQDLRPQRLEPSLEKASSLVAA